MRSEPPSFLGPRGRDGQRRQRRAARRRLAVGLVALVLAVAVVVLVFRVPGLLHTTRSTTTSQGQTTSLSTATGSSQASSTPVTTADPTNGLPTYNATLTGAEETPAVSTSATGNLALTVAADGSSVDYVLTVSNITSVTVARLHEGNAGSAGPTIFTIYHGPTKTGSFSGTLAQGSYTAADLLGPLAGKTVTDLVTLIKAGSVYLNVGSSANIHGEIRGQLK